MAARSIQIVDRQKTIQLMQKECLAERKAEIYRTLLKWDLLQSNATANNLDRVANPYLEGSTSGMNSNCLECHRHAVYRKGGKSDLLNARDGTITQRFFTGIAGMDHQPPITIAFDTSNPERLVLPPKIDPRVRDLQAPACYFAGALQTHFLWTIALHKAQPILEDPCSSSSNPSPLVPGGKALPESGQE